MKRALDGVVADLSEVDSVRYKSLVWLFAWCRSQSTTVGLLCFSLRCMQEMHKGMYENIILDPKAAGYTRNPHITFGRDMARWWGLRW